MTEHQEAYCLNLLAQRMSLKHVAEIVGVSDWDVAELFEPSRVVPQRKPRPQRPVRRDRLESRP